jgi:RNA polymerase sigma-70 factor (ECF subfamily)
MEIDDSSLLELIAKGHTNALSTLYDRYNRLVYSLALAFVRDEATAEEITLDVFVQVWQKANTYRREQAKVSTWLSAITRHRSIDILRRQNSRPDSASTSWEDFTVMGTADHTGVYTVEEDVESSLQRERIKNAIAQLPLEQQKTLAMAYFYGYTHEQIAKELALPLGTVKTRIWLAMQKLKLLLVDEQIGR